MNSAFILIIDEKYVNEAFLFDKVDCRNKILLTINFDIKLPNTETYKIDNLPKGTHFMEYRNVFKKYYESDFSIVEWVKSI